MRDNGQIIFYATKAGEYFFNFQASSFAFERDVYLVLNNQKIVSFKVGELKDYSFKLNLKEGRNEIILQNLQPAQSPLELNLGKDRRPLSLVLKNLSLL